MEDNELEEGEACCYIDDDASIDPDKSFSYIEEKVHNLLGHHVKLFDGGVSSEDLGALHGEYGSFLPMYQRSPLARPQQKTPQRVQTYTTTRSPLDMNSKDFSQHSSISSDLSVSLRPGPASRSTNLLLNPKVASADVSTTRDSCMLPLQVVEKIPLKLNSSASKLVNLSDQPSLKVRIKVGSGNKARKNTSIYSGLGLTSPSSADNSPEQSGGMSVASSGMLGESPGSILQNMTSFPVPGSLLLSPLPESMLCLVKKENQASERKLVLPIKGRQKMSSMFEDDSASMPGDGELKRKKKLGIKSETLGVLKHEIAVESEENMTSHMKKSKEKKTTESKQCLPNDLKVKLSSSSIAGNSLNDSVRSPEAYRETGKVAPVKKREINKERAREKILSTDISGKESLRSSYGEDCAKNEQLYVKSSSIKHINEPQVRSSCKEFSAVHSRDGGRTKYSGAPSVSQADSDASTGERNSIATAVGHLERKVDPNSIGNELDGKKIVKEMLPFKGKQKFKASQHSGKSAGNLMEEGVKSSIQASRKDRKAALKVIQNVRNSYKDVLGTGSECTSSQMKLSQSSTGVKAEGRKLEAITQKEALKDWPSAGEIPLEMAPAPDASEPVQEWVQCDSCQKWRSLPWEVKADQLPNQWLCSMLNWLPGMNHCDISEDDTTNAVNQLNFQNHADRAASGVTSAFGQLYQNNQNFITDAPSNQERKKYKLKPTNSSSGLMHTSKVKKDCAEESVKNKSSNDMNQHLLEKKSKGDNAVDPLISCNFGIEKNSPKQFEKHANEGDMKRKKLKRKQESDQYDHKTLKNKAEVVPGVSKNWASENDGDFGRVGHKSISGLPSRSGGKVMQESSEQCHFKNENHVQKDRLVISVKKQRDNTQISLKSGSLDRKNCDQREVHAKKRKLRDWQDSQSYLETSRTKGNHLPDDKVYPEAESSDQVFKKQKKSKILCTEGKESSTSKGDDKSYKNSAMTKIILSTTRDNSIHQACEKDQQRSRHREKVVSEGNLVDEYSSRKCLPPERFSMAATSSSSNLDSHKRAGFQGIRSSPVESVSSSPMRTFHIDKLSPSQRDISIKDGSKDDDSIIQTPRKSLDREANVETNQSGTKRNREASRNRESSRNVLNYHDTGDRQNVGGKSESRVKHISRSGNSHFVSNIADTVIGQKKSCTNIHVSNNCSIEGRISKKNEPEGATLPQKSESSSHSTDKNRSSNLQRVRVKISDPLSERELTKKIHMNKLDVEPHGVDSRPTELIGVKHQFLNHSSLKSNKDGKNVGEKGYGILESGCQRQKPTEFREYNGSEAKVDDLCREERGVALRKNAIQGFEVEIPKERVLTMVESAGGKFEFNPCLVGKVDKSAHLRQPLSRSREGGGLDVHPSDASCDRDLSKVLKEPGVHHSVGNVAPDCSVIRDLSVPCAVKEDISGQAAKNALKEAEAAKDLADRIKNSGFDLGYGYNEAYFEAALKFLHCASLLEACSTSGKWVEMDQMQVYSITAKLFKTCAQEFEKRKEMTAAALAYKGTEVAYLKLVYCKNSLSNKDRHDLEASLQMIPHGESPSSSASDIDNLNCHAAMDKAALSRGNAHAGNHVIVARNRPNFMRLLDFTNDVTSAMEASRKSQDLFAAANTDEAQNKEGIISVKKVIEFSFQDVEELIRLVRHASKVISGPGFSGNRG